MVDRHHPGKAPTAVLAALGDGSCRTIADLETALDLTARQVSDAAANLLRRDYLMRMEVGCYKLTDEGIAAAQRGEVITSGPRGKRNSCTVFQNTFRQRAWLSMRTRGRFTLADLVCDAATEHDRDPLENARRYVAVLVQAGYVLELPRRKAGTAPTSNGYKLFALAQNTGRAAPIYSAERRVLHDPNRREDVPCKRA